MNFATNFPVSKRSQRSSGAVSSGSRKPFAGGPSFAAPLANTGHPHCQLFVDHFKLCPDKLHSAAPYRHIFRMRPLTLEHRSLVQRKKIAHPEGWDGNRDIELQREHAQR